MSPVPALPAYAPRPAGIPVASFAMQKILTKTIRHHADNQNLNNTAVKGPEKVGGKRGVSRAGRPGRTASTSKK